MYNKFESKIRYWEEKDSRNLNYFLGRLYWDTVEQTNLCKVNFGIKNTFEVKKKLWNMTSSFKKVRY